MREEARGTGQADRIGGGFDGRLVARLVERRLDRFVQAGNREESVAGLGNPLDQEVGLPRVREGVARCGRQFRLIDLHQDIGHDAVAVG